MTLTGPKLQTSSFDDGKHIPAQTFLPDDDSILAVAIRTQTTQLRNHEFQSLKYGFLDLLLLSQKRLSQAPVELAYPIVLSGTTLSVLHLRFQPRQFVGELTAAYLERLSRLEDLLRPLLVLTLQMDKARLLQEAVELAHHSTDMNSVIDRCLSLVVHKVGFAFATLSLVDEQRTEIRCERGLNVSKEWVDDAHHPLVSDDIQAWVVRTGQATMIRGDDPRLDKHIYERHQHAGLIRVFIPLVVVDPLTGKTMTIGTIEAGYPLTQRAQIDPEQCDLLVKVGEQLAIAISRAQLIQQVRDKAEALTRLHHLGQGITRSDDLSRLLPQLVNGARELLNADLVMLYRYNGDKTWMHTPVTSGKNIHPATLRLNLTRNNLLSKLAEQTTPLYVGKNFAAPGSLAAYMSGGRNDRIGGSKHQSFMARHGISSFAALPLIVDGERVGLLIVNYKEIHAFEATECMLHDMFAQKAAMAIWTAQARERAQEDRIREERNTLSREMHDSVKQSLVNIRWLSHNLMQDVDGNCAELRAYLGKIESMASTASNETEFIMSELRAPNHELQRLVFGLHTYVARIRRFYDQFHITFDHVGLEQLPDDIERKTLRFARESINNAIRHSKGRNIYVHTQATEAELSLVVRDDGNGFDKNRVSAERIGLKSLHELAAEMNGRCEIQTSLGRGTQVRLVVPLNPTSLHQWRNPCSTQKLQAFENGGVNPWMLL
jgi:signal transduction histidine kinase